MPMLVLNSVHMPRATLRMSAAQSSAKNPAESMAVQALRMTVLPDSSFSLRAERVCMSPSTSDLYPV